ncbi:MAG: DinB family protein [Armatimonadota bacterium]|nr:DinB family protein [Armatimonadota bacterium]MDR7437735.1 DinB family protein [Armatimonadota bacterium]MDR7471859.1 DinB family protein [Armatimonadota bacterium]MDR7507259.1 DinB family protein [Armatimonadota bacterium]MDR7509890.1 DinB family protein [Armatimonadota bacterium]
MTPTGREELAIQLLSGYPPEVGRWLWALQDVRRRYILRLVQGLDQRTLDWQGPDERENAIGSLLYHIALVEMSWLYYDLLLQPKLPADVASEFPYPMQTPDGRLTPVLGEPLQSHLARLARSRQVFLEAIRELSGDEWRRLRAPQGEDYAVTPEWVVFHLVEHEAGHAFQISSLKRRAARWFETGR